MRKLLQPILVLILTSIQLVAQNTEESWDTYIATYENGMPGSTTLRMDIINETPITDFDFVLVTGITYKTTWENGFPDDDNTFKLLHKIGNELIELINNEVESILVGSFMYEGERLEYFYIKEPKDLKNKIESFYEKNYPRYKYYINIKEDKNWEYYRNFLFPNEETQNYMADESVLRNLKEAGDDLSKERRVNHWLYFSSEQEMKNCRKELINLNFKIESSGINEKTELPYELEIWRIDKVDIDAINPITSKLREVAKKYNGDYDGWDTTVEKE